MRGVLSEAKYKRPMEKDLFFSSKAGGKETKVPHLQLSEVKGESYFGEVIVIVRLDTII
jgi:hypothetical protein